MRKKYLLAQIDWIPFTVWKHRERNRQRNIKNYLLSFPEVFWLQYWAGQLITFFRADLVTILKALGYGVESKSITTYTIDEGKCPAWIHYVQAQYIYYNSKLFTVLIVITKSIENGSTFLLSNTRNQALHAWFKNLIYGGWMES